jgi:hypothetical protein
MIYKIIIIFLVFMAMIFLGSCKSIEVGPKVKEQDGTVMIGVGIKH